MITSIVGRGPAGDNFSFKEITPGADRATRVPCLFTAPEGHPAVIETVLHQQHVFVDLEENGLEIEVDGETFNFNFEIYER